jgi:hypothetical protein
MPDDAKSIIREVIHEVCKQILKNPVLHPHSPDTPIPVPPPVENPSPIASESIMPGLCTMSLSMMAALQVLQESAPPLNEPAHPLQRTHRRQSSGNTCRVRTTHASAPSPPDLTHHNCECSQSPMPSTMSCVTIVTTDPNVRNIASTY